MRTSSGYQRGDGSPEQRAMDIVCFTIAGDEYGIDVGSVLGVNPLMDITPLPGAPGHVRGIVNVRGRVMPVVGLSERFGVGESEDGSKRRIVVTRTGNGLAGIVVDAVTRVVSTTDDDIAPPPVDVIGTGYLSGVAQIESSMVLLVDPDAVTGIENLRINPTDCGGGDEGGKTQD